MSDNPKIIDLRQATLANLTDQLRLLTDAIIAANKRWDMTNREVVETRIEVNREFGNVKRLLTEVHSEVVTQANEILRGFIAFKHNGLPLVFRASSP